MIFVGQIEFNLNTAPDEIVLWKKDKLLTKASRVD